MKKLYFKFISLFCAISLFLFCGALPITVMGLDNNIILNKNINKFKESNNYNVNLNVKINDTNKNKNIILVVDENNIDKSKISIIKKQMSNFATNILDNKNCNLSIVNFSNKEDKLLTDFTSNKDILEKVINNICDKKLENCKVSTLNLENQLNKMNKNTDKYVIFLTDSSIKENLNTEDNYENLINKYKNVNFMVINLNSKLQDNEGKNLIISSFNSNNKDKIFQVKNNEELKQNCEKIENSILKGNRCYKNIVIEDEIPNNFEILSSTINDEKSNPIVTNNKVQWKVDEIPSKGINIKYTIKPKEGFTPKENVFENINGKLVCEEVTYGENKQVNKKIVKFENCLVNNSEKVPKKVIQNENNNKVEVQKEETNLMAQQPKESKQLGIVTLQNQVESSNPYIYTYYMFSYEIKGKTDICKNFGGVFKDGNSVYTTKLPLGEYSLILSKPIKYDFVEIELNGKKVSAQQLKDGRLNINLTEANPTINIKVKTKEYNKPYFSNSDYIGTNVFPDPNS